MDRRKALKMAAGAMAVGGVGAVTMATAFKPEIQPAKEPKKLSAPENNSAWKYVQLDASEAARRAYADYKVGSCMYGVFNSVISQLAEKVGEPFASFPSQMMKYGHGGVSGSGTICGTLNGAAALIGLLVSDKKTQDMLVADLFYQYENTPYPVYVPEKPGLDFTPPKSVAKSVLCHASTTRWGKTAGFRIDSKERKERCRRLTADIAAQTVEILNNYFGNAFVANAHDNETTRTCMTCHGSEGKLGNTTGKMTCTSCHDKSMAHKVFADSHYKYMKKR